MATDSGQTAPLEDELDIYRYASVLGANVARLRKESHLNKRQFSLMSGVSRQHLDNIENGKANPRLADIVKIADALGTAPAVLLMPVGETRIEFKSGHAGLLS